jgi:hypothetical protein
VLGSDDFWERVSGRADFRVRLVRASVVLSRLVKKRAADEVARIRKEAKFAFGDAHGNLDLEQIVAMNRRDIAR